MLFFLINIQIKFYVHAQITDAFLEGCIKFLIYECITVVVVVVVKYSMTLGPLLC